MRRLRSTSVLALPAMVVYALFARHFLFVQDDAYITYRYVANFVAGHGLVFNVGERVEGFTNFGWTVILALFGALGLDYITVSQVLGFIGGLGVILVTAMTARRVLGEGDTVGTVIATLLVGGNMSLAYWSPAGLETAAFAFFAFLSLYWFLCRSRWLVFSLVMAVWIRPEGALVAIGLLIIEAAQERRLPRYVLSHGLVAFILSLPMVVFKIVYYGSLLPNSFYAKTGLGMAQLTAGLEYVGRFFSHYGFYGIPLLVVLLFYRRLSKATRTVFWFTVLYVVYILLIGGDVLKVHRFFLPILGCLAIITVMAVRSVVARVTTKRVKAVTVVVALPLVVLTCLIPRTVIENYNAREKALVNKMAFLAENISANDTGNFLVAVSTIGRFSYELLGHHVIDLLGLTDTVIARHSDAPIPDMETTWKEQKHNAAYVLRQAPDYIVFSTGIKPSAPAERALLLYREFQQSYRAVGWPFPDRGASDRASLQMVFKRYRAVGSNPQPYYSVGFVENYKQGLDHFTQGDFQGAVGYYRQALKQSPRSMYPEMLYNLAYCLGMMGKYDESFQLSETILGEDSMVFEAHRDLYKRAVLAGDSSAVSLHHRWLHRLVPWYLPHIDSVARDNLEQLRSMSPGTGSE